MYRISFPHSLNNIKFAQTTDTLHLQAILTSGDPNLRIVFDECWATPSMSLNDPTSYGIISKGWVKKYQDMYVSGAVGVSTVIPI